MKLIVNEITNERLDKYLTEKSLKSRSTIQKMILNKDILVNGKETTNKYKVQINDEIEINEKKEEDEVTIKGQNIPLNIVYEDDYLLVINKPSNMVVHPAVGNYENTLVNALIYYFSEIKNVGSPLRPGIVHRIDKNTSGLLLVAKDNQTHELLSKMIANKEVVRKYKAIVHGNIAEKNATIKAPIGRSQNDRKKMAVTEKNSKHAQTNITIIDSQDDYTLIECQLLTGRTHQIRVHLKFINHPVVGDPEYGPKKTIDTIGQALHAYKLEFLHPITEEKLIFQIPSPKEFLNTLEQTKLKDSLVND